MQTRLITVLREVPGQTTLAVSPNASVAVYEPGGMFTTLASGVMDGEGNPSNPLTANANGQVRIGAPDGSYDIRFTHSDGVTKDILNEPWADQLAAAAEAKAARDEVVPLAAETLAARDETASAAAAALAAGRIYATIADGMAATVATTLPNSVFWARPNGTDGITTLTSYQKTGAGSSDYLLIQGMPSVAQLDLMISIIGSTYETGTEFLWAQTDGLGNTPLGLLEDGRTVAAELVVGAPDEDAASLTRDSGGRIRINGAGFAVSAETTYTLMDLTGTDLEGAVEVEADGYGFVRYALFQDGAVLEDGTGQDASIELLEQITLPDGAQGQNPNGGYTGAGAVRLPNRLVAQCNDGRQTEADPTYRASVVILHPDLRRIYAELPMNTADFPGIRSVQGLAADETDNSLWVIDNYNRKARHITLAGAKLLDELTFTHDVNGCARSPNEDGLFVHEVGTSNVHVYSCSTGAVLRTLVLSGLPSTTDQFSYYKDNDWLLSTSGSNGSAGQLRIWHATTGSLLHTLTLDGSQAVEGVFMIPAPGQAGKYLIYVFNDGAFHTVANPPLALCCVYLFSPGA